MTQPRPLAFNDPAPDLQIQTADGESIQLSSLWARQPLLLVFTRHFGCTQCKEMLDQLTQGRGDIDRAGLALAAVTQGHPAETRSFCAQYAPGMLCLSDPERRAYAAYGLERGNVFQTMLSPRVWDGVARAGRKGYRLEPPPPGQDAMQMSGTFIIGTDGRIRLPYYYENIADHPPLSLLLKGVLSTDWDRPFDGPLGPEK